jgi:hypothetical protein
MKKARKLLYRFNNNKNYRDISKYYNIDLDLLENSVFITNNKISFKSDEEAHQIQKLLHTSPKAYEQSKLEFDSSCSNMIDYLKLYNLNDCWLLQESIEAYGNGFLNDFGVNVHNFMSLPGLAQHVALKFYDESVAPIYSFGENFLFYNKEIRNNLDGGLCMVFHRMMAVGEQNHTRENGEKLPESAIRAPNGELFQRISSFDFNSVSKIKLQVDEKTSLSDYLKF